MSETSAQSGESVTDELRQLYDEAYGEGFFVREFTAPKGFMAGVGDVSALDEAGIEDVSTLTMGDIVMITMPGGGATRVEAVSEALTKWKEHKKEELESDPDRLTLFGEFIEKGYRIKAFIPRKPSQQRQWTINIFRADEEEAMRTEIVPMIYEPIFGVDVEDKANLEKRVDQILEELS